MNYPRTMTPQQRERSNERKRIRKAERWGTLHDYVVTVTQDHFVNVRGRDEEDAKQRAIKEIANRWGGGRNPVVTEVELLP